MTKYMLKILKEGAYKSRRTHHPVALTPQQEQSGTLLRRAYYFAQMMELEQPYLHEGERIGIHRTNIPPDAPKMMGNIIPDYDRVLREGMLAMLDRLPQDGNEFQRAGRMYIESTLAYADRYAAFAKESHPQLHQCLQQVPRYGARNLLEACVFLKLLLFTLRMSGVLLLPLGRFDCYMRPYYQADRKAGKSYEELAGIIEEFFVNINLDSDLYYGIQLGDNGMSMVLGGNGSFDEFSRLCMEASLTVNLIDPKINLRVDKNTPDELYELGTQMTKQGLGFPQYLNDDVIIPGLIELGYEPQDAENYGVAACWEPIIPGKSADVANLLCLNYPSVVNEVLTRHLTNCETFEQLMERVDDGMRCECDRLMEKTARWRPAPMPYLSLFMDGCIEQGKDLSEGVGRYNNYGCHGNGIATAADSLMAVREVIFESKEYSKEQLLDALAQDFNGYDRLRNRLLSCPKMGNGHPEVDRIGYALMESFSRHLNGKPNTVGGVFRAGTGSAQYYWTGAEAIGATADGRHAGAMFGSSYSPSLEARLVGPLSCMRSFAGFDLTKVINGGPLTMEMHDTVFRNEQGIKKVAQLVKAFVALGGHQLQLNSINRDILLDAMEHPENHKNLIVRVWGWSGYFVELDEPYQKHILMRNNFFA